MRAGPLRASPRAVRAKPMGCTDTGRVHPPVRARRCAASARTPNRRQTARAGPLEMAISRAVRGTKENIQAPLRKEATPLPGRPTSSLDCSLARSLLLGGGLKAHLHGQRGRELGDRRILSTQRAQQGAPLAAARGGHDLGVEQRVQQVQPLLAPWGRSIGKSVRGRFSRCSW